MDVFDTHAHLLDNAFDADRDELIKSLPGEGVEGVIECGTTVPESKKALALAEKYPFIYFAAGVHPHCAANAKKGYTEELKILLQDKKCVAVGEIGLDYHYDYSPKDVQRRVFEEQLQLAIDLNKPAVIHMRKSFRDTLDIIKKYKGLKGVMHCFSGSAETAGECLNLGLYISFTGSVTFKNAHNLQSAAAAVPAERLMAETDCPCMTPEPMRGQRNDPSKVKYVLTKLSELKNISYEKICRANRENIRQLFKI